MQHLLKIFLVFSLFQFGKPASITGSVELDEYSFDKIVKKFDAALVKFDVAFPYGEKHEAFVALAKDARESDELLVAEVGVKDYGEKDNEALAKKYGATKENFPIVKLFLKNKKEPLSFDDSKGFTSDELRKFVREKTGIYLNLPGCIKQLDLLAVKFMKASNNDRPQILEQSEKVSLAENENNSGKTYRTIMQKVIEKGDEFIKTEYERVKKLQGGKISEEKKKELGAKINILQSFYLQLDKTKGGSDEL